MNWTELAKALLVRSWREKVVMERGPDGYERSEYKWQFGVIITHLTLLYCGLDAYYYHKSGGHDLISDLFFNDKFKSIVGAIKHIFSVFGS